MVFAVGATSTFTMMATTYVAGDILTVVAGVRRDIG
jgi:hypothetical protein